MKALAEQIGDIDAVNTYGRVVGVRGLMVEIAGPIHAMSVGARIVLETGGSRFITAAASIKPASTNAGVQSLPSMTVLLRRSRAVKLLSELANQCPFWPGKPLVVLAHHEHALLQPSCSFDDLGRRAIAAEAFRAELHDRTSWAESTGEPLDAVCRWVAT